MMGQDNITWTGARAPGVERCRSLAWRCSTEQVDSDTERRPHAAAESTKGGGKPDLPTGMLGASLTEADQGRPYLTGQLWSRTEGKPAVRNLRGDDGNVGIIRSPVRAIVLPDTDLSRAGCGSARPEANQVPRETRVSHGKRTGPRRGVPVAKGDRRWRGRVGEQSYAPIVPTKAANRRASERSGHGTRRREGANRKTYRWSATYTRHRTREVCPMELSRIAELAKEDPGRKFYSIAHFLTPEALYEAFLSLRRDASAGVDHVTYRDYEEQAWQKVQ